MCRLESEKQMHMIRHSTDGIGNDLQIAGHATEVGMQTFPPFWLNQRHPVLGAENDVNVK